MSERRNTPASELVTTVRAGLDWTGESKGAANRRQQGRAALTELAERLEAAGRLHDEAITRFDDERRYREAAESLNVELVEALESAWSWIKWFDSEGELSEPDAPAADVGLALARTKERLGGM